ncbi:carboxylate-amine ligase [Hansschlegelia quercus]|nr:carboxylate-amine ligase [Hansschlegelia quercus]
MDDGFQFGIEEEFFLADVSTGASPDGATADRFHARAEKRVEASSHELLKGQIEIQTEPGTDFDAACAELRRMRQTLAKTAEAEGLLLFAAGSHPLAQARSQEITEAERYEKLQAELRIIAERSMVCATHIHVSAPEPDARIQLMNRLIPFLPLFYALSVASPFWQGQDTGLKGFRPSAFSEWPRMGVPELFADQDEYRHYVTLMVDAGVIRDSSFLWWHIRPSEHYPTIELRICDAAPRVEDGVAIAALYQALLRCASRMPGLNGGVGPVDRAVCTSNIWQVQQFGRDAKLIDPARGGTISVVEKLEATLDLVAEDVDALGSASWVARTREMVARPSAAERQLETYRQARAAGTRDRDAMLAVVTMLADETKA